jgi:molybdate/tungstate transport system ATP-binding protein
LTLKIDHVSKKLGMFSLKDVSLEVAEGEYFVLLGPTGAGKTVLLEVIMGFHYPDKGKVLLNDQNITNLQIDKREIAYVPQNCPLFPHMNVFENVEFGLKMRRVAPKERNETVKKMLEAMSLEQMAKAMPSTLSGGERQKVVLSRVLITEPKIVLLDEPLTSIDAETSRNLRNELKRINREFNVAFLHVTHDQMEAFSLASKVAIMMEGKIVQAGTPNEVLSNPIDESVARFLGYENVLHTKLVKYEDGISEVSAEGISIKMKGKLESDVATIAIRPEDLVITAEAPAVSDEWNSLEGKVGEYTNFGPIIEVTIDAGLMLKAFIDKRSFLGLNLVEGKSVHVAFKIDSVKIVNLCQA